MFKIWYEIGKYCRWDYYIYIGWSKIGKLFGWDERLEEDDYYITYE